MADRRDREGSEGPGAFERAMEGVKPLEGRDQLRAPPKGRHRGSPRASPSEPVAFSTLRQGERIEGLAPGIDRRHLRRLRAGEVPVEVRVDLHGRSEEDARREVGNALARAHAEGARCVLVVHGRGVHSPEEPVLKRALVDWLAAPPVAAWVMAFASATPADGGPGATYVLLRRPR